MMKISVKNIGNIAATALLAFLISGCAIFSPPPVNLPSRSGITPGETITVQGNQNVYAVAKQYDVSMREIIVLNNMRAPFTLRSGQKLVLPANKLGESDPYGLASYTNPSNAPPVSGGYSSSSSSASVAPTPISASSSGVEQEELPPIQSAPISSAPLSPPPSPISGSSMQSAPLTAPGPATSPVTELNAPSPAPKTVPTTAVQAASAAENKTASPPTPSVNFKWPVQGPVLSGFGPKGQGLSNDGVNIGAPKGAPVIAAGNGIVVYAGNEMKGFGNLVLIRHQGGWVTAYAHLDRALVNKDAVVDQGDMIGTVGKTGNVPSPQLHFETRYNGKPVDPAGVIQAQ